MIGLGAMMADILGFEDRSPSDNSLHVLELISIIGIEYISFVFD